MNIVNVYDTTFFDLPSTHQDFYQKLLKYSSISLQTSIIQNILNEEKLDLIIIEIFKVANFEQSDLETKTCYSIEEFKKFQDYEMGIFMLDDICGNKLAKPRVGAMFKRSRNNILYILVQLRLF